MPSLKDLKIRINSVKSTKKITKAMQMVAAAKLRRAQDAAEASRPFTEQIAKILLNLQNTKLEPSADLKLLQGNSKLDTHLLLVMTADRGLCGGFNTSILKIVREQIKVLQSKGKKVLIYCVGRKSYDGLKRQYGDLIIGKVLLSDTAKIDFNFAKTISEEITNLFAKDKFDICEMFYSRFRSVILQIPTMHQIIPIKNTNTEGNAVANSNLYEYEPDAVSILKDLLPKNLSIQILSALMENAASEQGARMSAMDSATRNAGRMIDRLTLVYNRTRQANITKELIEIISGADAV